MCTRYYMEMSPELRPIVEKAKASSLAFRMVDRLGKPLKTSGEIFPTDMVPVIASSRSGARTVFPMVWGYDLPGLSRPVVNARVESAPIKDVWKSGWLSHRCAVPASWYFEWEHFTTPGGKVKAGDKYLIQANGSSVLYLAGLYRFQQFRDLQYPVFTVLTRGPTPELQKLHDRMPLILPSSVTDDWINPKTRAEDLLPYALTDVCVEKARQQPP